MDNRLNISPLGLNSLSFDPQIGSVADARSPLENLDARTVDGEQQRGQPEENASGFRDFVLRAGGGRPSLLNALSAAFGQGTEEIAARRRGELQNRVDEKIANDFLNSQPARQTATDVEGRLRFLDGERENVFPDANPSNKPVKPTEFSNLLKGLSPDEAETATRIKLGLEPRAVGAAAKTVVIGGVPHIFDPNNKRFVPAEVAGKEVTAESVGESLGEIGEKEQIGKGRGNLTSKTIDAGFESIGKIRTNVANINRAISALDKGARTGAIDKFLPNVSSASVELGQIQKELGLDIIGAVTFGALSKGELDLALSTALPVGLDEASLRDFLVSKRDAQQKLSEHFVEQINFLDQGGSIVDFLNQQQNPDDLVTEAVDTGQTTATGGKIFKKANGDLVVRE